MDFSFFYIDCILIPVLVVSLLIYWVIKRIMPHWLALTLSFLIGLVLVPILLFIGLMLLIGQ